MGLNDANRHVDALTFTHLGGFEHGIRLANPRHSAEKNLQPAATLLLRGRQPGFGGRAEIRIGRSMLHRDRPQLEMHVVQ
jgi:hypothetical protein